MSLLKEQPFGKRKHDAFIHDTIIAAKNLCILCRRDCPLYKTHLSKYEPL